MNFPSQEYTKYLWQNDDDDNENACFLDNRMLGLLKGRSARDILCLRQQMKLNQNENTNTNDESTAKEATDSNASIDRNKNRLESLCEELDTIRRKKSSALAHISNVHWDDVGGLAHVRREIMDAIELPLKHPHLFPKSGGRSGILLYGKLLIW